jgi:hypothetical protein
LGGDRAVRLLVDRADLSGQEGVQAATRHDVEALTVEGAALRRALGDGSGNSNCNDNGNGSGNHLPLLRLDPVAET